jgi:hypothetical protein
MAYSVWWPTLVRHQPFWTTPGDMWFTVRTAHWIGWGSLSYVYSNYRSALVTLPGFELLLTPIVMLGSALHLSEVAPGLIGPWHPTAWLLVGPLSLACTALPLFALDALARRLGIVTLQRRVLAVAEAGALWSTVALWGHPEDVLALGLVVYSLLLMLDRKWALAGWLLGGALTMQLLVIMVVPLFIGLIGWRKSAGVLTRAAVLPGFLLLAVAIPDYHAAMWVLVNQPSDPIANHVTPWIALAPSLHRGDLVAGGLGRLFNVLVAVAAAFVAMRWRADLWRILWLVAAVLAARCIFEAVMVPYYVMPGIALALVTSMRHRVRETSTMLCAAGLTVMVFTHHGRWEYWLAESALSVLMLALAWPGKTGLTRQADMPAAPAHAEQDVVSGNAAPSSFDELLLAGPRGR